MTQNHPSRPFAATISDDLLRHVAPLGWEHIGLTVERLRLEHCRPTAGRYAQSTFV